MSNRSAGGRQNGVAKSSKTKTNTASDTKKIRYPISKTDDEDLYMAFILDYWEAKKKQKQSEASPSVENSQPIQDSGARYNPFHDDDLMITEEELKRLDEEVENAEKLSHNAKKLQQEENATTSLQTVASSPSCSSNLEQQEETKKQLSIKAEAIQKRIDDLRQQKLQLFRSLKSTIDEEDKLKRRRMEETLLLQKQREETALAMQPPTAQSPTPISQPPVVQDSILGPPPTAGASSSSSIPPPPTNEPLPNSSFPASQSSYGQGSHSQPPPPSSPPYPHSNSWSQGSAPPPPPPHHSYPFGGYSNHYPQHNYYPSGFRGRRRMFHNRT